MLVGSVTVGNEYRVVIDFCEKRNKIKKNEVKFRIFCSEDYLYKNLLKIVFI